MWLCISTLLDHGKLDLLKILAFHACPLFQSLLGIGKPFALVIVNDARKDKSDTQFIPLLIRI